MLVLTTRSLRLPAPHQVTLFPGLRGTCHTCIRFLFPEGCTTMEAPNMVQRHCSLKNVINFQDHPINVL